MIYYVPAFARACIRYFPNTEALHKRGEQLIKDNHLFSFLYHGEKIRLYLPDVGCKGKGDDIQSYILKYQKFYEYIALDYVSDKYLKKGMVYLDCGANIGNHTIYFAKIAKAAHIYSFEAIPQTYKKLRKNLELNGLLRPKNMPSNEKYDMMPIIETYNYALGAKKGKAKISYYDEKNLGSTAVSVSDEGNLPMVRIDDFKFRHIDFVKIDVEGFEADVLQGMTELLKKDRPVVWVEIFPENLEKVNGILNDMGYYKEEKFWGENYIFKFAK